MRTHVVDHFRCTEDIQIVSPIGFPIGSLTVFDALLSIVYLFFHLTGTLSTWDAVSQCFSLFALLNLVQNVFSIF